MYRAFEGANGWYVAWERSDGSHNQPQTGPWYPTLEAAKAAAYDRQEQSDWERDIAARKDADAADLPTRPRYWEEDS